TVAAGSHTLAFVGPNTNTGDNTAFIDLVSLTGPVSDHGFENPRVGSGPDAIVYNPSGTPWRFTPKSEYPTKGSGGTGNGSHFTAYNPNAPEGTQVAFLQDESSISQTVSVAAGAYRVSFQAAQQNNSGSFDMQIYYLGTFEVKVDGAVVGIVTPTSTSYQS